MPRRYELQGPVRGSFHGRPALESGTRAEVVEVRATRPNWCLVVYRPVAGTGESLTAVARREDWGDDVPWPPRPGDVVEVEVRPRVRLAERRGGVR